LKIYFNLIIEHSYHTIRKETMNHSSKQLALDPSGTIKRTKSASVTSLDPDSREEKVIALESPWE
jgi:hypothetical protein